MTQQQGQGFPQDQQGQPYPPYEPYPQPAPAPGYGQPGVPQAPAVVLPPLAHWGKRVLAMLVDVLVILPFVIVGAVLMAVSVRETGVDMYGRTVSEPSAAGVVALLLGYGTAIGIQVWNRWVRQGRTGQSLGKRALGIRLLSERTMAPVGPGMSFARDLCHVVDGFFYLGYLWPLWDPKRQTFSDKIIGTVVLDG